MPFENNRGHILIICERPLERKKETLYHNLTGSFLRVEFLFTLELSGVNIYRRFLFKFQKSYAAFELVELVPNFVRNWTRAKVIGKLNFGRTKKGEPTTDYSRK